jgi:hypothetical protein
MKTKQLLAVFGSILLFLGVFAPLISFPIVGSLNYFQNGKGDGFYILALAATSLILALTSRYEELWLTGGGSLAVLTFTFVQFQLMHQQILSDMNKELAGNPFAGLAQLAVDSYVDSVQIQWGWALLLVGVGMVLAGAALKDERTSARSFFSLRAKTLAIVGLVVVVAVGTWGAAKIGYRRSALMQSVEPASAIPHLKDSTQTDRTSTEVSQYLAKIDLSGVEGGMRKGGLTCFDHECAAVWGRFKNTGDRTVSKVVITAYFPNSTGQIIFEKRHIALLAGGRMSEDSPLRPGYIKEFGYVVGDCPTECVPENVRVSVTDLSFVDDEKTNPASVTE